MAPSAADRCRSFEGAILGAPEFTINLGQYRWKVDVELFASKSKFFAKICEGKNWKESTSKSVTLHDDDPHHFARLLQYIYYDEYQYSIHQSSKYTIGIITGCNLGFSVAQILQNSDHSQLQDDLVDTELQSSCAAVDVQMFLLGSKYCVQDLKDRAKSRFDSCYFSDCEALVSTIQGCLTELEPEFQKSVAEKIASLWHEVRNKTPGTVVTKDALQIEQWILDDNRLHFMVTDAVYGLLKNSQAKGEESKTVVHSSIRGGWGRGRGRGRGG